MGVQLYRRPLGGLKNAQFHVSHGLAIVWLGFGIVAASTLWVLLSRENRRRDEIQAGRRGRRRNEEEQRRLGDRRLDWRYHV